MYFDKYNFKLVIDIFSNLLIYKRHFSKKKIDWKQCYNLFIFGAIFEDFLTEILI